MTTFFRQLFILSLIFSLIIGCEEEDSNCGCNSEIVQTIPETSEIVGQINYKEQTQTNSYYTNKYWITYVEPDCPICVHHMIVCNESFITNDIISLLKTQESVNVKFSGHLKEVCEKRIDIASITYKRIVLTRIEEISTL